jgi:hypothetical protein
MVVSSVEFMPSFSRRNEMNRFRKFMPLVAVLVGIASLGVPSQVNAAYKVTLTSGVSTATINDDNVPAPGATDYTDVNPVANSIIFVTATGPGPVIFAGYTITFSGSTNSPATGGTAMVTSNTITVAATAAATAPLVIDVLSDGFDLGLPPGSYELVVHNSVSTTNITTAGATASSVTTINGSISTAPATVTGITINDSDASPTLVTGPTALPFSINSTLTISGLATGGTANVTWTSSVTAVPVHGALVLLATGLPVLGAAAWRKRRKLVSTVDGK